MRTNYHAKLEEGCFYHLYNRTNGNDWLFANDGNYVFFLNKWKVYISPYIETVAYCLMGNHFHFVICVKKVDNAFMEDVHKENTSAAKHYLSNATTVNEFLEDQFKRFFNSYAAAFNKQQSRHGSLFQKRFRRVLINNDVQLLNKICYVHHNPIHHNISDSYEGWRYTSYHAYITTKPTNIARQKGLSLFGDTGESNKRFMAYHKGYQENRLGFLGDDIEDM